MPVAFEYGLVLLGLLLGLAGLAILVVALIRRSRRSGILALWFLAAGAILVGRVGYAEFWQVDFCMDSGGRYNDETKSCEYS